MPKIGACPLLVETDEYRCVVYGFALRDDGVRREGVRAYAPEPLYSASHLAGTTRSYFEAALAISPAKLLRGWRSFPHW